MCQVSDWPWVNMYHCCHTGYNLSLTRFIALFYLFLSMKANQQEFKVCTAFLWESAHHEIKAHVWTLLILVSVSKMSLRVPRSVGRVWTAQLLPIQCTMADCMRGFPLLSRQPQPQFIASWYIFHSLQISLCENGKCSGKMLKTLQMFRVL